MECLKADTILSDVIENGVNFDTTFDHPPDTIEKC